MRERARGEEFDESGEDEGLSDRRGGFLRFGEAHEGEDIPM